MLINYKQMKEIKCDLCEKLITGDSHPVTDENFNVQKGINQCESCFASQCEGE